MASVLDLVRHYQHAIEKYSNDEQKILKCIDKLFHLGVTVQHLQDTGVGRTVNALRKEEGEVGRAARALVCKWKLMVTAEESDQEDGHNDDTSNHNGHGSGKESDDNVSQAINRYEREDKYKTSSKSTHKSYEHTNGNSSGSKRKYHSSEEEEPDGKKYKHSSSSDNDDYQTNHEQLKKEESNDKSDYSHSDNSGTDDNDSDLPESSEEEKRVRHKIKTEPPDTYHSSSKHSSHSNSIDKKEFSISKKSHGSSDKYSKHHKSESSHSDKSSSKEKSHNSHKNENHKEKERNLVAKNISDSKYIDKEKKHKEQSNKHNSSLEKHKSHSQKRDSGSDKSRDHTENTEKVKSNSDKHTSKSEQHTSSNSHKPEKHQHKSSSEKENSSDKHKSRDSRSKEKHGSSSKEKSKDRSSSSKEKSIDSQKSEKKHSTSESKSKSKDSKSKSENRGDKRSEKKSKDRSVSSSSEKRNKSHSSISSKLKEDVPKIKPVTDCEDNDDGIDCGSGASFAEALGMISPAKPKKKSALKSTSSPTNSFNNDLSPATLLAPTAKLAPLPALEISALPEISPNYKPRPPPKLLPHLNDEDAMSHVISSKNQRTKVYSGNKTYGKLPTLFELCVQVLQEHIDSLEFTGGVPYEILKPVVDKSTPQQLFNLEHFNPYLMEDTDHLWQKFCEKQFRSQRRQEMETWRDMYIRCQEEQEYRLKSLTANIKIAQEAKKAPIKQTKMAYVDSVVKPPRNIAKKQALHGTAHSASASPASRVASLAKAPNVLRGTARPFPGGGTPTSLSALNKPKKAPLMQKALQFMRGRKR